MSPIGLLTGSGILIASVTMGIGLGSYASGHDHGRWSAPSAALSAAPSYALPPADAGDAILSASIAGTQPDEPVRCKGCGPTLAEREMAAAEGRYGALGYGLDADDPVMLRYLQEARAEEARWNRRDAERAGADRATPPLPASSAIAPAVQPIAAQRIERTDGLPAPPQPH